jgi:dipeptidyl aminopeptidase/acylaminoacyl peptidase
MSSLKEIGRTAIWMDVIVVAVVAVAPADAQVVPDRMAFTTVYCHCTGEVCAGWCSFPNGSSVVTPFTETAGPYDFAPAWSPDATRIAFVSGNDIVVMDAGGSPLVNITNTAAAEGAPAWSPDGQRIAFASDREGQAELYYMNPDGSDVVRVTTHVGFRWSRPAWSPDSARIAFDCEVDPGNVDICVVNVDGTGFGRLTSHPGRDGGPAWSPDDAKIAFATTRYGTEPELAVMRTDDGSVSQLAPGTIGWDPAWSPDGSKIAFSGYGPTWYGVWVMNADGSDLRLWADAAVGAAWMPGPGSAIARFSIYCSGLVCSFDASNSGGTITGYTWDFGDQATATGMAVSHAYAEGGSHTIALTVTDVNGVSATEYRTIYLNRPPVASFTVSCDAALTCLFDWSGTHDPDGFGLGFGFDFGGETTGWVPVSSSAGLITYARAGSYTATLRVFDSIGATTTASRTFTVTTPFMHIGDVDGSSTTQQNTWTGMVTIDVHSIYHGPVANAVVTGSWNNGTAASCTTNATGRCVISRSGIPRKTTTVSFTVTSASHGAFVYQPAGNHDPDGDSNGTAITISRQ